MSAHEEFGRRPPRTRQEEKSRLRAERIAGEAKQQERNAEEARRLFVAAVGRSLAESAVLTAFLRWRTNRALATFGSERRIGARDAFALFGLIRTVATIASSASYSRQLELRKRSDLADLARSVNMTVSDEGVKLDPQQIADKLSKDLQRRREELTNR